MKPFSAIAVAVCMALAISTAFVNVHAAPTSSPHIVTYIDRLSGWWPPAKVAASIGVPGYAPKNAYTTFNLAFWTSSSGPVDAALVWADAYKYVSSQNPWGNNTAQVQAAWLKAYHAAGQKVMVSAFGSTDMPTSQDPVSVATALAAFVKKNQLDGADLDYEDNNAMNAGKGEAWLIACTTKLRQLLPASAGYIISHAPQAPYFMGAPRYPKGGYLTVDKHVGSLINFYNVQFYNQVSSKYATFDSLFVKSTGWANGTALAQIVAKGVPASRLVLGKPVTQGDASNTGYVPIAQLSAYIKQAVSSGIGGGWATGTMGWQFASDPTGSWSQALAHALST